MQMLQRTCKHIAKRADLCGVSGVSPYDTASQRLWRPYIPCACPLGDQEEDHAFIFCSLTQLVMMNLPVLISDFGFASC